MALRSSSVVCMSAMPHGASAVVASVVEGSNILKIQGYCKIKELSNGESIKSGTFDVGGHSWYIQCFPDGDKQDDAGWISVFLCLKNSCSATEVEARSKFSLLDEVGEPVPLYSHENWSHIHKFKTLGWGGNLIERKTLEESSYLKDDCFRVRCDVMVLAYCNQYVTVPPPNLDQHIGQLLLSSQVEGDVTFQVGTETFTAHRVVLAARSPVFMAELFGPMKEKNINRIKIDEMEAGVFKAMLHFIYTDSLPDMDKDDMIQMAQHLLVAADRYDLERLKLICEDKLCSYVDRSTVTANLELAEQHSCRGLKEACFEYLKFPGNLKEIMFTDGYQHLTSSYPSLLEELVLKFAS